MKQDAKTYVDNAKAVIFDMDGVLIDTIPFFKKTKYQFLEKYRVTDTMRISRLNTLGMGIKDEIQLFQEQFGLIGDIDKLAEEWRALLYHLLLKPGGISVMPGAVEFVKRVHKKKSLAIATGGHKKEVAKELLRQVDLHTYFTEILSSDDVKRGKPHPDVYLRTAEILQVEPMDCVVIEDAANGTIAAKQAHMSVIAVNSDKRVQIELKHAGADAILSSLTELL